MSLRPQQATLLGVLVRRAGEVVLREELYAELWPEDTHVDYEHGLNFCIRELRVALGDDARDPTFIETLPRRGYRFLPPVAQGPAGPASVGPGAVTSMRRLVAGRVRLAAAGAVLLLLIALAMTIVTMPDTGGSADRPPSPAPPSFEGVTGPARAPGLAGSLGLAVEVERAYLAARFLAGQMTVPDLNRAELRYREAIDGAPGFAAAHAGLASLYNELALVGARPRSATHEKALGAAHAALRLDPSSAEAHTAVGIATLYLELDWDRAAAAFDRALAADPDHEPARWWRAHYLVVSGHSGEAVRIARATRLNGADGDSDLASVGWLDYLAGDFDDAAAECRRALDLDRDSSSAASCLMLIAGARGDEPGAVDAALELMRVLGLSGAQVDDGRALYAGAGGAEFWGWYKASLGEACPRGTLLSLVRAFTEMRRNRPSAAVAELEAIISTRAYWAPFIAVDPAFEPLRGRPDFEALVASIRAGASA